MADSLNRELTERLEAVASNTALVARLVVRNAASGRTGQELQAAVEAQQQQQQQQQQERDGEAEDGQRRRPESGGGGGGGEGAGEEGDRRSAPATGAAAGEEDGGGGGGGADEPGRQRRRQPSRPVVADLPPAEEGGGTNVYAVARQFAQQADPTLSSSRSHLHQLGDLLDDMARSTAALGESLEVIDHVHADVHVASFGGDTSPPAVGYAPARAEAAAAGAAAGAGAAGAGAGQQQ